MKQILEPIKLSKKELNRLKQNVNIKKYYKVGNFTFIWLKGRKYYFYLGVYKSIALESLDESYLLDSFTLQRVYASDTYYKASVETRNFKGFFHGENNPFVFYYFNKFKKYIPQDQVFEIFLGIYRYTKEYTPKDILDWVLRRKVISNVSPLFDKKIKVYQGVDDNTNISLSWFSDISKVSNYKYIRECIINTRDIIAALSNKELIVSYMDIKNYYLVSKKEREGVIL